MRGAAPPGNGSEAIDRIGRIVSRVRLAARLGLESAARILEQGYAGRFGIDDLDAIEVEGSEHLIAEFNGQGQPDLVDLWSLPLRRVDEDGGGLVPAQMFGVEREELVL